MSRHLISIDDLDRVAIERILGRALSFAEVSGREIKKVPALKGRTIVNLFYEASTRTSSSFELAAKRLSADVVSIRSVGSSVDKGESLKDTVQTLSAYDPAAIVIRSPFAGAAQQIVDWTDASVVNAGDGKHEHPTQALLDVFTLTQAARQSRGAEHLDRRRRPALARGALEHPRLPADGRDGHRLRSADADSAPDRGTRLQLPDDARGAASRRTWSTSCGCSTSACTRPTCRRCASTRSAIRSTCHGCAQGQLLMHPGPVNRGVELSGDAIDSDVALIGAQVKSGVAVRMAVLYELLVGAPVLQAVA